MNAEYAALIGVGFAVVTWLLGLSFFAGKLAEKIHHHESWRVECREDLRRIYEKIDNIWGRKFDKSTDDS